MGFFSKLFGGRSSAPPGPPVYPVVQNFFTPGPGLSRILPSGETKDPNRLHATFYNEQSWRQEYDQANPAIDRVPMLGTTQYYKQVVALPNPPAYVPAHGVQVPPLYMQHGWREARIPDELRRTDINVASPPVLLSQPISVRTIIKTSPPRSARLNAKAPKTTRAGGAY